MATIGDSGSWSWRVGKQPASESTRETSVWEEVSAWLALLPVLFITVSGRIQTDSGPVAFRFTAMEEDSIARRMIRLGCSFIVVLLISRRFPSILQACKEAKLLLFLPALAFTSILWSQNPRHTLVDASNLLLTTLFALYLYLRYPGYRLASFLNFAAFVSLALCLLSVIAFPSVGIDAYQQYAWRGIFGQRNNCAAACTLFMAVGFHAQARGLIDRFIRGSVLLLSLVFIVMSGSRTGWLIAALTLMLICGLRFAVRIRSQERLLLLMAIAVPALLIAFFIRSNLASLLTALDKDPTLSQRTVIWTLVLPSIAKHPLVGYGYSSFWAGLNGESMQTVLTTGWLEGQAQDGYLDILLQLGLVGLVPVILLFARAFRQAFQAIERGFVNPAVLMSIVLLPLILVENIGESSLLLPLGIPWFYALLALLTLGDPRPNVEET